MGKDAIPAGEHPKLAYIAEKTAELKEMCLEDTDEYIKYKRMLPICLTIPCESWNG